MASLPLIGVTPGFYQVCTSANTDYPTAIPTDNDGNRARALIVWFETSAADATVIKGRIAFGQNATTVTPTGTDTLMGYHPAQAVEYNLDVVGDFGATNVQPTHVHVANSVAGAVARGMWLFAD